MGLHAHPSPVHSILSPDPVERLAHLSAGLPIAVRLGGLAVGDKFDRCAPYYPRVRRSGPSHEGTLTASACCDILICALYNRDYVFSKQQADITTAIQHIDVVTCWKGLTYSQASELAFWEQAFRHCLTLQVESSLRMLIATQLRQLQSKRTYFSRMFASNAVAESLDGLSLLLHLNECLAGVKRQTVNIDEQRLIDDMMRLFYDEDESFRSTRCYGWATGSRNLPRFLWNFLRTQDCFLYAVDGPKLLIDKSSYEYRYPIFNITAEVVWSAPEIRFDDIPASVQRDEMYRITPVYLESLLPASIFNPFSKKIRYTLDESDSGAQWDSDDDCFRMVAPIPSAIEVSAPAGQIFRDFFIAG